MVYIGSGYAVGTGATAGNVLLAFGIDSTTPGVISQGGTEID